MRKIEFRGKTCEQPQSGKWRYGGIVHMTDYYGKPDDSYRIIEGDDVEDNDIGFSYKVSAETVGQFTGLYDDAGEKIFEGDIVRYKESNCSLYVLVGAVEFHGGAFGIRWVQVNGESHFTPFCAIGDEFDYKVVGNIHENRDLLEANDET